MRRPAALAVVVALTLVGATGALGQEQRGIGIRLAEAPAGRADDPRAQSYIVDHLSPGTEIERDIEVSNATSERRRLELYVGPARVQGGSFVPGDRGSANHLTRWSAVRPGAVSLDPGQRATATVRIVVPADAPSGEHYAAVWAELPAQPPPGGGFGVATRVGIRIYLSVGEGSEPGSDFEVSSLTASREDDGRPVVSAAVENTGGRALDMNGELQLTQGPGGLSAGPFPATVGTTLGVGQRAPVRIALDERLPRGPWRAVLVLRSGQLERRAEATIAFPAEPGSSAAPVPVNAVTGTTGGRTALAAAAGLLATLVLALGVHLVRRRGRRRAGDATFEGAGR